MTTDEAQKALDDFWDAVKEKYGEDVRLTKDEHQKLLDLEKQYSEAKKAEAFNN